MRAAESAGCALAGLCLIAILSFGLCRQVQGQETAEPARRGIEPNNRLLLVRAQVARKPDGIVLVVTASGALDAVTEGIAHLGGAVEAAFPEVGYLRARMPLARLADLQSLPGVVEARVDGWGQYYAIDLGTNPNEGWAQYARLAPPPRTLPTASPPAEALKSGSPYTPIGDMGIPRFRSTHPTADGRGVTIAVLEVGSIAFDHPALQLAREIDGASVPKLSGIIDPALYEPPRATDSTLFWPQRADLRGIRRLATVHASEGTARFSFRGQTYWAPRHGDFNVGLYVGGGSPDIGGQWHGDSLAYVVLWDSTEGTAWVDGNRNRDFRDEAPLRDVNRAPSMVGYLERTGEPGRDSIPFVVAFDSATSGVRLYPGDRVWAMHMTMVASVAAGGHLLGGEGTGAAPAARILLAEGTPGLHGLVEAFIRAARDPRVDLITCSQYEGNYPADGGSILPLIQRRLIQRYGKPILAAAGNSGPVLSSVDDQGNGSGVLSVGAYASGSTYRAQFDWALPADDWITSYSARGPAANGQGKPDLVAPAIGIAAAPCDLSDPSLEPLAYALPRCYMLSSGTSAATPAAAGAAAVLISLAKQRGVPYDARHLAWAMRVGARSLAGFGVHAQGHGLVDVARAWELLQTRVDLPDIVTSAPVRGTWDRYLRVPGVGVGLYEREGWRPGARGTRIVTLTRTSGRHGPTRYLLRWRGNDGAFAARSAVTLPLGRPVALPIHVTPRTAGIHSAELELLDPRTGLPVHWVSMTVVAAEQFNAANHYRLELSRGVPWPEGTSVFLHVPPGTAVLRLDLAVKRGRYRLRLDRPSPVSVWSMPLSVAPIAQYEFISAGNRGTRVVTDPEPGVWELTFEPTWDANLGTLDSAAYHVSGEVALTASVSRADAVWRTAGPPSNEQSRITAQWNSGLAGAENSETVAEIGKRKMVVNAIGTPATAWLNDIPVDSGATSLRVDIAAADTTGQLDLYLFDCTGGPCYLWNLATGGAAKKSLVVRSPKPGRWQVVVDPARVPANGWYRYTEIQTNPAYGAVGVSGRRSALSEPGAAERDTLAIRRLAPAPNGDNLTLVADLVDRDAEDAERGRPLALPASMPVMGTAVIPLAPRSESRAP